MENSSSYVIEGDVWLFVQSQLYTKLKVWFSLLRINIGDIWLVLLKSATIIFSQISLTDVAIAMLAPNPYFSTFLFRF